MFLINLLLITILGGLLCNWKRTALVAVFNVFIARWKGNALLGAIFIIFWTFLQIFVNALA